MLISNVEQSDSDIYVCVCVCIYTHTHSFLYYFHRISNRFYHRILNRVLCAMQSYLVVYPSYIQKLASANPNLPVHPSHNPLFLGNHQSVLYIHDSVCFISSFGTYFYFIVEYKWFTMLCEFQIHSKVIQLYIYRCLFSFRFFPHKFLGLYST